AMTQGAQPALLDLLRQWGTVDQRRVERAQEIVDLGRVRVSTATAQEIAGEIVGRYRTSITLDAANPAVLDLECDCPDWQQRGQHFSQPCKHLLALALKVGAVPDNGMVVLITPPQAVVAQPPLASPPPLSPAATFRDRILQAVAGAISALADQVEGVLAAGEVPFLIGPTGCGKTSAVRLVATRNAWGFEEVSGSPSFADADLAGVKMAGGVELAGPFARAFRRARDGEVVLLFIDEFLRFNTRAQDILVRPLLPTPPSVAQAMGIRTAEFVRLLEAPLWGVEWAPCSRARLAIACNPWGSVLDPAVVRRVTPVPVAFAPTVARLFTTPVQNAIEASWKAVQGGQLPLPIEYQALTTAEAPDDRRFLAAYFGRLGAIDPAAAEGFRKVLQGIGVTV
ncbi:MAG: AAA family ATPase, partial [Planctomycetes bacterium]|nr:AAA family ATPase [Planctomycetota bacterium]